jgi:catechol 2,3-dioxygenase-like lactoylglutathione lyase family enzyme
VLDRIALNVSDPAAATRFYCEALGFAVAQTAAADPVLARLLGVRGVQLVRLRRGRQMLELCACEPAGAPMPAGSRSNDGWFQHCALATGNIAGDYERLRRFAFTPISCGGPRTLPGGITAFKFRDPDGHPLELIEFPAPDQATSGGIDHSAICVAEPARSIAFYAARAGLAAQHRQLNRGPAQDALDNLDDVELDVIALDAPIAGPHVELLHYRHPHGRTATAHPSDIVASRLVFAPIGSTGQTDIGMRTNGRLELLRDPDGHMIMFDSRA